MANVQTQNRWRRRMAALMLTVMLLVPCMPRALAADLSVDAGFYLKQSRSGTCTLTAAAMMLRRRAYLDGLVDWVDVTENSVRPQAWANGLSHSFTYKAMKVRYATLPADQGAKTQALIDLLAAHPEGIVLYDRSQPHAILLTDYTNGVFYCSDPAGNITAGRVPIDSASVSIAGSSCYWYIAEDQNAASAAAQSTELQLVGGDLSRQRPHRFGPKPERRRVGLQRQHPHRGGGADRGRRRQYRHERFRQPDRHRIQLVFAAGRRPDPVRHPARRQLHLPDHRGGRRRGQPVLCQQLYRFGRPDRRRLLLVGAGPRGGHAAAGSPCRTGARSGKLAGQPGGRLP